MPYKPGHPKYGGRKKGTKNKKRVPLVSEYLASKGVNPIQELLNLIPTLDPDQQASALKFLVNQSQPTVRANPIDPASPPATPEQSSSTAQLLSLIKGDKPTNNNSGGAPASPAAS